MNAENHTPKIEHPARARHQTLTIALHWTTVLLVLTQFILAILHDQFSNAEARRDVLAAHRSLGAVIWLLALGRLAWRLLGMRLLPFPASMARSIPAVKCLPAPESRPTRAAGVSSSQRIA